jgi:microcystin-dependent protein
MADVTISQLNAISPSRSLTVPASDGSTTGKLTITQVADLIVPIGSIMMWSGSVASIPSNWAICDGNNGTPNLKDRFVVGAGAAYAVNDTGGAATHVLTVNEMPAHDHTGGAFWPSSTNPRAEQNQQANPEDYTHFANTGSAGGGAAHNNMPPYLALAYIMRIS